MPIPDRFLDELVARTDLVDLVSESVRLTKKGNSYWGCCPFHSEKTPSFHVVPDRQIYKCFGCGKGGGAINYVMELENLSFRDAVEVLAKRAGMAMPEGSGPSPGARERLLQARRERFYQDFVQRLVREARNLGLTDGELRALLARGMNEDGN